MLDREIKAIWQTKTGFPPYAKPFVQQIRQGFARALSIKDLADCMSILVEYETKLKKGTATINQCLDQMLLGLCRIFGKAKGRR